MFSFDVSLEYLCVMQLQVINDAIGTNNEQKYRSAPDICRRLNGDLIAELREVICDLTGARRKREGGKSSRRRDQEKSRGEPRARERAAREAGDLRAEHVFMQRVAGIVISP